MKPIIFALCILCLPFTAAQGEESVSPAPDISAVKVLDLKTAQRIALKDNPGISAAQARLEQAKARVQQAMAADMPSVDASGSTGFARYSDKNFAFTSMSDPGADQNYETGSLSLQASWLMFDGYSRKFQQEQAKYGVRSFAADRNNTQRLLISAVADAFFNAQLAKTSIKIAESNEKFYKKQLKDAKSRLEAGSGSSGDVLNIKVQLNSAKNSIIINEQGFEAALYGLAALLGVPGSVLPDSVRLAELDRNCDISADDLMKDANVLIQEALLARPDLKTLAMRIKTAEAATDQAKSGDWPKVRLIGQVGGNNQDGLIPTEEDFNGSIALSASWNLYSGGAVDAAVLEARQAKREAVHSHAQLRNNIAAEVRQDIAQLAAARKQVSLQRKTVDLVEKNRTQAQDEYEAGFASLVRLNEAQRDLTATYGGLVQALVGYQQAKHRMLAAVGRNLKPFSKLFKSEFEPETVENKKTL